VTARAVEPRRRAASIVVVACVAGVTAGAAGPTRRADDLPPRRTAPRCWFERNVGQADARWDFVARGRGLTLLVAAREAEFLLACGSVRMRFDGAAPRATCAARGPLPGESRYLVGDDRRRWLPHVPHCSEVAVAGLADGVDLRWRAAETGNPEYDLVVAPGADAVPFRVEGGATSIGADGALTTTLARGRLSQSRPRAYQDRGGEQVPVEARFVERSGGAFAIELGPRDPALMTVVDPEVVWSSYLGGADLDDARYVAVDAAGATYVFGTTISTDFPSAPSATRAFPGHASDVYVAKFSPDGASLVWSTYVGGSRLEYPGGMCVDATGRVSAACRTQSGDFPLVNPAFAAAPNGGVGTASDAVVFRLDPAGADFEFSTYLGGTGDDLPIGVGLLPSGELWVGGTTNSADFPAKAPLQAALGGQTDFFLARFDAAGALVSSTTLGGPPLQFANSMAVGPTGVVAIAGNAIGDPTAVFGAATRTIGPVARGQNVAVAAVNPDGTLAFAEVLGGTKDGYAAGVAVDGAGAVYVVGGTHSKDFPLRNALLAKYRRRGSYRGLSFATKLAADGSLVYSTFLDAPGGAFVPHCVAVDALGGATLGGELAAFAKTGEKDAPALLRLSPSGDRLVRFDRFATEAGSAQILSVALTGSGFAQVAGRISTTSLPGPKTVQASYAGKDDGFVLRIGDGSVTAKRVGVKLNFARPGHDSIRVTGALEAPALPPASSQATIDFGGVARTFTVDAKGRGRSGADVIRFRFSRARATFSANLRGDFAATLADEGLTGGATVRRAPRTAELSITEDGTRYIGTVALQYTAKAGARGVAVVRRP